MLQATFIFLGLSLDSFVTMMQKGAVVKDLPTGRTLLYSFVYALINTIALITGYVLSRLFDGFLPDGRVQFGIAGLVCFTAGIVMILKTIFKEHFEERLDDHFTLERLAVLAGYAGVLTMVTGIGLSLYGFNVLHLSAAAFAIWFLAVLSAQVIGYRLGAGYQRCTGICGGLLMLVFSVYIIMKFVLLR